MKIKLLLTYMLITLITIGCGGGGGNDSTSEYQPSLEYEGKKTEAQLTNNNQQEYLNLISHSFSSFTLNLTTNEISISNNQKQKNNFKNLKIIDSKTTYGKNSGSVSIIVDEKSDTEIEIIYTFNNYDNDEGIYLDGKLYIQASLNSNNEETDKLFFEKLIVKTSVEDNIIDGVITIYNYNDYTSKVVENYIIKDNKTNSMYKYDNFISYRNENSWTKKYSGKLYHSKYGYVNVTTLKELTYNDYGELTANGELKVIGKESVEYIKFAYEGRVRVELDYNNDNKIDNIDIYQLDEVKGLVKVPNKAPYVEISFPKAIYTDSDLSKTKIDAYDPDLDKITFSYEWSVNNKVVSNKQTISNSLFKKHDNITLCVTAKDLNNTTKKCESQEVLNSYPKIEATFNDIDNLIVGDTTQINSYTITDADNDPIVISWRHYRSYDNNLTKLKSDTRYVDYKSCEQIITEYELKNNIDFDSLDYKKQEQFKYDNCNLKPRGELVNINFISDNTFIALDDGVFTHEMIISDSEANRTKLIFSNISKMALVEKVIKPENSDSDFIASSSFNMYIKDLNNDGYKELTYAYTYGDYRRDIKFIVEFREKEDILNKNEYNLTNDDHSDFINYYLGDFNKDGYIDILSVYDNFEDGYLYKIYYQNEQSSYDNNTTFQSDESNEILIENIIGNEADDIIISRYNFIEETYALKIFSKDNNITIPTESSNLKILVDDIDSNSKKDLLLVKRDKNYDDILDLNITILAQDNNEEFSKKYLYYKLGDISNSYDYLVDLKVVNIDDNKYFLVLTDNFLFILKLDDDKLIPMYKYKIDNYLDSSSKIEDLIDINGDGKKDIIITDISSFNPSIRVFIQQDNFKFYEEQKYDFENILVDTYISSYVFGDIDNDNKPELFFNSNSDNVGAIYFK